MGVAGTTHGTVKGGGRMTLTAASLARSEHGGDLTESS